MRDKFIWSKFVSLSSWTNLYGLNLSFLNQTHLDVLNLSFLQMTNSECLNLSCFKQNQIQMVLICPSLNKDKFKTSEFVLFLKMTHSEHLNLSWLQNWHWTGWLFEAQTNSDCQIFNRDKFRPSKFVNLKKSRLNLSILKSQ